MYHTISDELRQAYDELKGIVDGLFPRRPEPRPLPPDLAPSLKIACVITCVDYADFLAFTLPTNRHQFDRMVVVTTPGDTDTQRLCAFWDVECVVTDAFTEGGPFCKGKGINAGLERLGAWDGWVIHLDADILLPAKAKRMIELGRPDPSCVYGVDRLNCKSFEAWCDFLFSPSPQHQLRTYCHHGAFPTGSRIVREDVGYVPIGFFQLWHPSTSGVVRYPAEAGGADRDDVAFPLLWPSGARRFLPEFLVYHLESAAASQGANWNGRTTPRFGPAQAEASGS